MEVVARHWGDAGERFPVGALGPADPPSVPKSLSLKQFYLAWNCVQEPLAGVSNCVFNSAPVALGPNRKSAAARLRCVNLFGGQMFLITVP